mgnify:FL=1
MPSLLVLFIYALDICRIIGRNSSLYSWYLIVLIAKDFGFAIEVLISREFSLYNGFCWDGSTDPVSSRHDCLGLPLKALIARDSGTKDFGFEVQVLLQKEFDLEVGCWALPNDPASSRDDCLDFLSDLIAVSDTIGGWLTFLGRLPLVSSTSWSRLAFVSALIGIFILFGLIVNSKLKAEDYFSITCKNYRDWRPKNLLSLPAMLYAALAA